MKETDSLENVPQEVTSDGGRYDIQIGIEFTDEADPEYTHSLVWWFSPTLATDSQNARLEITQFLHKKYYKDVEPNKFTEDDGSEIVKSVGWFDDEVSPDCVPDCVKGYMRNLFGQELIERTFEHDGGQCINCETIPEECSVEFVNIEIKVEGSYVESLSEDNPLVGGGHFTSEVKDAETGEVLSKSYRMNHDYAWWIHPNENTDAENAVLEIEKCYHKRWDKAMSGGFTEEHPGERILDQRKNKSDSPPLSSLPDDIIETLCNWFGEEIIKRSVEINGEELPKYVYECFDCDSVNKVTPRRTCPECGSDSVVRYSSLEDYKQSLDDENKRQALEMLVNADVSISKGEIN